MKKDVVDLFAGIGGFRVALNFVTSVDESGKAIEKNKWKFVWANQWEPSTKNAQHAYDCYVKRFENPGPYSNDDINTVSKKEIPNHSLLVGGFPCQDYSVARTKSNEKGIEGLKGVLFWQIAEILQIKKTPFVLLENVDRLLKSPARQRGRDFGIILKTFADLEYNLEWRIINAADFGGVQRRRRIFIFAWKKELKYNSRIIDDSIDDFVFKGSVFAKSFPINIESSTLNKAKSINLNDYIDTVEMTDNFSFLFENSGIMINGLVRTQKIEPIFEKPITLAEIIDESDDLSDYVLTPKQIERFEYLKNGKRIDRIKPNGEPYVYSEGGISFPDSLDLPGRTMLTSEASVNRCSHVIEDRTSGKLRFITPIEAERMQSFPDNWTKTGMPKSKRYFMMGNALVTKVISRIEPELGKVLESEE